jgi:hypothetical protein
LAPASSALVAAAPSRATSSAAVPAVPDSFRPARTTKSHSRTKSLSSVRGSSTGSRNQLELEDSRGRQRSPRGRFAMSSASRTCSEGLKGTRNLRTMATDSQPASLAVARFQIHSDTELEADLSGRMDEEDQQMVQAAEADSSGGQLAPRRDLSFWALRQLTSTSKSQ